MTQADCLRYSAGTRLALVGVLLIAVALLAGSLAAAAVLKGPGRAVSAVVVAAAAAGVVSGLLSVRRAWDERVWLSDEGVRVERPGRAPIELAWESIALIEHDRHHLLFRDDRGRKVALLGDLDRPERLRERLVRHALHVTAVSVWAAFRESCPDATYPPDGTDFDGDGRPAGTWHRLAVRLPDGGWEVRPRPRYADGVLCVGVFAGVAVVVPAVLGWAAVAAALGVVAFVCVAWAVNASATRLRIDDTGLTVRQPLGPTRRLAWSDLESVTLHRPGPRLRLAAGGGTGAVWLPAAFEGVGRLENALRTHAPAAVDPAVWAAFDEDGTRRPAGDPDTPEGEVFLCHSWGECVNEWFAATLFASVWLVAAGGAVYLHLHAARPLPASFPVIAGLFLLAALIVPYVQARHARTTCRVQAELTHRGVKSVNSFPWGSGELTWAEIQIVQYHDDWEVFRFYGPGPNVVEVPRWRARSGELKKALGRYAAGKVDPLVWHALDDDLSRYRLHSPAPPPPLAAGPDAAQAPDGSWRMAVVPSDGPLRMLFLLAGGWAVAGFLLGVEHLWHTAVSAALGMTYATYRWVESVVTDRTSFVELSDRGVAAVSLAGRTTLPWGQIDRVTFDDGRSRVVVAAGVRRLEVRADMTGHRQLSEFLRRHAAAVTDPDVWAAFDGRYGLYAAVTDADHPAE